MTEEQFRKIFVALSGIESGHFPWQRALYQRFVAGDFPPSCDLPTGLGKTSVIALWLIALANNAAVVPRRLVYVVDRRAVVDQATDVAMKLRASVDHDKELKESLGLGERSLPISTLRGQHVDNKEWLDAPASPAIIVGTVDMIGSRLLFEGYGTSRKMRPYHAGLLGADTLVVLDEAHLVPPFEKLLETIANGCETFGPRDESLRNLVPPFKLMSLSATGRAAADGSFRLQDADLKHSVVRQRLDARKRLTLQPLNHGTKLADALAEQAWKLSDNGAAAVRIIVFCDKRKDAEAALAAIKKHADGNAREGIPRIDVDTQLFVGGRRVLEREKAAAWLTEHGFIAGSKKAPTRPAFVFATSAGEVGVDLDADHMVSDLVAWERMVQRLGRVNRRGDGDANVIVIAKSEPKPEQALAKDPAERTNAESKAVVAYIDYIARTRAINCLPTKDEARDASPGAVRDLKLKAQDDPSLYAILEVATTPPPLRPALSRALVEAWSMTSLEEHAGRPEIDPWLRGWEDDDPQTSIIWRSHLPVRTNGDVTWKEIEAFFEAAPPHTSEVLETERFRVVDWLTDRSKALLRTSDGRAVMAIALSAAGKVRAVFLLQDLVFDSDDKKATEKKKEQVESRLAGATLVVAAWVGGLSDHGLLDHKVASLPRTVDDGDTWLDPVDGIPVIRFRVRDVDIEQQPSVDSQWRQRFRFEISSPENDGPCRCLIVYKWLHDSATEDDRSAGRLQLLDTHQRWAESRIRDIAKRLGQPEDYTNMLAIAARLHDEGKRGKRWQRAFNAPSDGVYAKTPGPIKYALLDGYRHEFGSLPFVEKDSEFRKLPVDLQDLALHLIAAHHGFARPIIAVSGCEDAPPSALKGRARDVALRFARLQRNWGPWGLAWWEALLRAADQQASRENDPMDSTAAKEDV